MSLTRTLRVPLSFRWQTGLISATLVLMLPPRISGTQAPETLSVNDPRPLNAAIKVVEQRCHCAITYEDPKWGADDVVDISDSIWHRPDIRPRIPKGGLFTFDAPPGLSSTTPAQTRAAMAQVVRTFEQSGSGRGAFRVTNDATTVHVLPRGGSILDTPVSIPNGTLPLGDVVTLVLRAVGQATGQRIELGAFPTNFFKGRVEIQAGQTVARDVLVQAFAASGRQLSWRLLYSVGMGQYYLNVHFVP
jgi:hypothetical protein